MKAKSLAKRPRSKTKAGTTAVDEAAREKEKKVQYAKFRRRYAKEVVEREAAQRRLLANLRKRHVKLKALFEKYSDHWHYEDQIYRFYHQSFKVFWLQQATEEITAALQALLPRRPLNGWFRQIVREGTGKIFKHEHNAHWLESTRTMVEAFFHARYFLDMAVRYGKDLKTPPSSLPSGWAGLLCLYDLR